MSKSYDVIYKIILLGDSGVGKSALVQKYTNRYFDSSYHLATIGVDFEIVKLEVDGVFCKVQIWDTAGQERFKNLITSYFRNVDIVILVCDVTCQKSVDNIGKWMQDLQFDAGTDHVYVLVGNKTDHIDRRITYDELKQKAEEYEIDLVFESSTKHNRGSEESVDVDVIIKQSISARLKYDLKKNSLNQESSSSSPSIYLDSTMRSIKNMCGF